jgi:putative SOS response-associated peptidase YedK
VCGRYVVKSPSAKVEVNFHLDEAPLFDPRYNVSPTQLVPAVRQEEGKLRLVTLRWGLILSWAKDAKIGYRLINARADTVATKPSFRSAFKRRRCLVPADGF